MRRSPLILSFLAGCTCAGRDPAQGPPGNETDASLSADTGLPQETVPTAPTGETAEPLAWIQVEAGGNLSCGLLNDQRTVCWGVQEWADQTPTTPFVQISLTNYGGCGLQPDGGVSCWCVSAEQDACTDVPQGKNFVRVAHASFWACAEDTDARLHCWGHPPIVRDAPTEPVIDWSLEENVGCFVAEGGRVRCWGRLDLWALADPDPALEPPPELEYTQVAVGRDHACALDSEGEIHCWGSTQALTWFPTPSPGPWVSVTASNAFACGLRAHGSAECWYDVPPILDDWYTPDERWAHLGLGEWHACGLTLDGRVLCWPDYYDDHGVLNVPDLADL